MNNYKEIDLSVWPRTELYKFYTSFQNPCFNVSVKIDAENIFKFAKERGESFFLMSLYAILRASNKVPEVRRRIIDGKPVEFEKIAAMTPIMTPRNLFCEMWCEYSDTFAEFKAEAAPKIEAAKKSETSTIAEHGEDFICASCVPWLHFESVSQAEYNFGQAIPILAWGKLLDGKIPISVKFNHCFLDGLFVSQFFDAISEGFSCPENL